MSDDTPFGYETKADAGDGEDGMIREEGPAGRTGFDPTPYMRQLRGRGGNQDYLDVKWRLVWLRREHPDAEILTEHVRIDEGMAIFKATVTVPTGGKASGYGSETAGDFGDFIEKAETKAIGRALNALGYGAQFSEKGEEEVPPPARPPARPTAPPRPTPPPPVASAPSEPSVQSFDEPTSDSPAPAPPPRPRPVADEPVPIRPPEPPAADRTARRERPAEPRPAAPAARAARPPAPPPPPGAADDEDDVDMADMTWTAFWAWARPLGYNKRGDIEEFLGHTIDTLTPFEVRNEVRTTRGEG